jgi:hypothetical protein
MRCFLTAVLLTTTATLAAAQTVPKIDVTKSCKATGNIPGILQTVDACIASENAARDQLVKQWKDFAAADRESCYRLTTMGTPGTYTELLTCVEMKRDARALSKDGSNVGLGKPKP